jgi:hypothetical protein
LQRATKLHLMGNKVKRESMMLANSGVDNQMYV